MAVQMFMFVVSYECESWSLPLRETSTETRSNNSFMLACVVAKIRDINARFVGTLTLHFRMHIRKL
jgi:hypothetical protein